MSTEVRPQRGAQQKRTAIVDAAEALFAESGFDAVSVRNIAEAAAVKLSVVTYHFPNKEHLFETVICRRSQSLSELRRKRLAHGRNSDTFDLVALVECYTSPLLDLIASEDEGWRHYSHLIAQISQSRRFADLISHQYDETAHIFIDALLDLYPAANREMAIRALVYLVSVMLGVFSSSGRVETLSKGQYSSDPAAAFLSMKSFIVGGVEKLLAM
ncbi:MULTISPECIES: TetR/AcrR family transcriptional regulator [unclassified Shinella]|uniref:TetR/AcrR family transcriptional regulator n=1 Tax=unclassified Shinella TaxID=2643062 RepID=UPI00234E3F56|nr:MULTISPECIES: TetR/AcrR family transcriptional regulator [unclassified Shinella]MDC7266855.1 TetR family transcriptional regulator [Shinella sp. HY16]MDC7273752.1 TetR family transcriptional regulator [Shinella sp. YZ44]